jgi:hypothetical protein
MILMALVCTALTKPLVILIEKFTADTSDPYSFADLQHNISPITEQLRRASRMVYGGEAPAEWTLPTIDVEMAVILEENRGVDQKASAAAAACDAAAAADDDDPKDVIPTAPAEPGARFWSSITAKSEVAAAAARQIRPADAAATDDHTPPPSPSEQANPSKLRRRHHSI